MNTQDRFGRATGDKSLLAMTLANIVARMEPTGRREAPPDDRLREIREQTTGRPRIALRSIRATAA